MWVSLGGLIASSQINTWEKIIQAPIWDGCPRPPCTLPASFYVCSRRKVWLWKTPRWLSPPCCFPGRFLCSLLINRPRLAVCSSSFLIPILLILLLSVFSRIRRARRVIRSFCLRKRTPSQVSTDVDLPAHREVWDFTVLRAVRVCSLPLDLKKNKSLP